MKRIAFTGIISVLLASLCLGGCSEKTDSASRVTAYYSGLSEMTLQAALSAEYPDYTVDFEISFEYDADGESKLNVKKPADIAGIAVRFSEDKTILEYDGASLEVGLPEDTAVSPVAALPDLLKVWSGGIVFEQGSEKVDGTDCILLTYKSKLGDTEVLYRTWFDADNLKPVKADIFKDGKQQIRCEFLIAENLK